MKKMLSRLALLTLLSISAAEANAQVASRPAPTAAELKKNFAIIEAGTEGESDDFDKLTATTARRLVTYLKAHEVMAAEAKGLGLDYLDSKDAGHLKVFTYSYASGGTRGTIDRPVFQWRNAAGQLFAYALNEECGFYEIHRLASPGRTLYLLLGGQKGDSNCLVGQAYVVELKGNYLLTDNVVFGKKTALNLCNVDMEFGDTTQVLHLDLTEYSTEHDETLPPQWYRPGAKRLDLKFTGGRFVKSS